VHTLLILPSENRPARAAVLAGRAGNKAGSSMRRISCLSLRLVKVKSLRLGVAEDKSHHQEIVAALNKQLPFANRFLAEGS
jgi:hypothetical protein